MREYMRKKRLDPAFRASEAAKMREWTSNNRPEQRRRVRVSQERRYIKDPGYRRVQSEAARENYRLVRSRLFDGYGNACSCCGETESAFLELDHVNGGGSRHFNSFTSPVQLYREVILAGFPPIYRLLCANCNRGRQRNGGQCPHVSGARLTLINAHISREA